MKWTVRLLWKDYNYDIVDVENCYVFVVLTKPFIRQKKRFFELSFCIKDLSILDNDEVFGLVVKKMEHEMKHEMKKAFTFMK